MLLRVLAAFTLEEIVKFRPYLVEHRQFAPYLTNLAMYHEQLNQAGYVHHNRDVPPLPEHILQAGKVQLAQLQAAQLSILVNPNAHGPHFQQMQQAQYDQMVMMSTSSNNADASAFGVNPMHARYGPVDDKSEEAHGGALHSGAVPLPVLDDHHSRMYQPSSVNSMEMDAATMVRMTSGMPPDPSFAHKYTR